MTYCDSQEMASKSIVKYARIRLGRLELTRNKVGQSRVVGIGEIEIRNTDNYD
jgi:hypothetical protein